MDKKVSGGTGVKHESAAPCSPVSPPPPRGDEARGMQEWGGGGEEGQDRNQDPPGSPGRGGEMGGGGGSLDDQGPGFCVSLRKPPEGVCGLRVPVASSPGLCAKTCASREGWCQGERVGPLPGLFPQMVGAFRGGCAPGAAPTSPRLSPSVPAAWRLERMGGCLLGTEKGQPDPGCSSTCPAPSLWSRR